MTLDLTDEERALINLSVATEMMKTTPISSAVKYIAIILKTQAGKMKAEFEEFHHECHPVYDKPDEPYWVCINHNGDLRHNWTDEQWLQAAKEYFSREGKG